MKLKIFFIILIIIVVITFTLLIILKNKKDNTKELSNIKYLHFTYTTGYHMNAYVIYDIEIKDGKYVASIKPTDIPDEDKKEYVLETSTVKEIEKKLNEYKISSWNGFHKSDKYVLDGDSFSLSINYENNENISASGYMSWPDNYREVKDYLDSILGSLYQ